MHSVLQGRFGVRRAVFVCIVAAAAWAVTGAPQNSTTPQTRPAAPPVRRGPMASFPQRPPADPAMVERGKALYGVNCNFCHGSDARGGEGGPNLLRSDLVLNDQNGELITQVVQNGKGEMPKLNLNREQVSDIAAYIHSFKVGGYDVSRMTPPSILVGDAKAGAAVFNAKCTSCHSASGDLKGIAARITDPKALQDTFIMPGGGGRRGGDQPALVPPTTVTVTLPSGERANGRLLRVDDFDVSLRDADGVEHTFRRDGDMPKVDIHYPLQAHLDMLPTYTDKEIHDLTAYLVTLK